MCNLVNYLSNYYEYVFEHALVVIMNMFFVWCEAGNGVIITSNMNYEY